MPDRQPLPPHDVELLARERAAARRERRWADADTLRARIEAAGWRPVDDGTRWTLVPLHPPDRELEGRILYGSADSVPSRLGDPDAGALTVVLGPGLAAALAVPAAAAARELLQKEPGLQLIVLLADPDAALLDGLAALESDGADLLASSGPLRPGELLEMAARCATGRLIAWLDPRLVAVSADTLAAGLRACLEALDDEGVAVAGSEGLAGPDLLHLRPSGPGQATALGPGILAFRRADARERGPLDPGFRRSEALHAWWSLVLRDEGEERPPRRALAVATIVGDTRDPDGEPSPDELRTRRRDAYRLAERFGARRDLLVGSEETGR